MTRLLLACALALLAAGASAQGTPDIVGNSLIPLSRNSGFPGEQLFVSVGAGNSGTAPAPDFPAAVYLSTDRFVSPDDVLLARLTVPGIGVQMNGGSAVTVTLPDVPRGGYQVLVALDDPDTVAEIDESNNVNSAPFTISPVIDGPDLVPGEGDVEETMVAPGGRISISYIAVNQGRSAVGDFEAAYYLRPINAPRSEYILLERETLGGLDAFEREDESEQVTVRTDVPPGRYAVIIILDDQNLVAESIETNNDYGAGLLTVTGTTAGEGGPGVAALALAVRPNPSVGAPVLSYTLAADADVRLAVVDALGREVAVVASGRQGAGAHTASVGALPPGVYAARLVAGAVAASVRFTVVR